MLDRAVCDIIVTSDLHGAMRPIQYHTNEYRPAGLALLATRIRQARERSPDLLLIDNGDLLQGSPLAAYAAAHADRGYSKSGGACRTHAHESAAPPPGAGEDTDEETYGGVHPFITVMNALGYDAAVPGNHEFNYGLPLLRSVVNASEFPWLSANIVIGSEQEEVAAVVALTERDGLSGALSSTSYQEISADAGEERIMEKKGAQSSESLLPLPRPAFGPPYIVKTLSTGVKVAILGVTTHYIPHWEQPGHIEGLQFVDALETVRIWVRHIRELEQPDVLVVSYHGGFECDLETGQPSERQTGENQGYAMCQVEGIDVLLTGHQHRQLAQEVHGVTVVQPGATGMAMGHVTLQLERKDGRWCIVGKQARLIAADTADGLPDAQVMELTEQLEARTQSWLDVPIGMAEPGLEIAEVSQARLAAHPFVGFMHQVQRDATGAELSVAALLSEEARGFAGQITVRDVVANFIYPNTLTVLELSGHDIKAALEQSARYFAVDEHGEIIVHPVYLHPKPQHYNYDMWSGIDYVLNVSRPVGSRVAKLELSGLPLDLDSMYAVVMNNYRAGGGGDYMMYAGKPILYEGADDMAALAESYIRRHQPLRVPQAGNWRVIAERE